MAIHDVSPKNNRQGNTLLGFKNRYINKFVLRCFTSDSYMSKEWDNCHFMKITQYRFSDSVVDYVDLNS